MWHMRHGWRRCCHALFAGLRPLLSALFATLGTIGTRHGPVETRAASGGVVIVSLCSLKLSAAPQWADTVVLTFCRRRGESGAATCRLRVCAPLHSAHNTLPTLSTAAVGTVRRFGKPGALRCSEEARRELCATAAATAWPDSAAAGSLPFLSCHPRSSTACTCPPFFSACSIWTGAAAEGGPG